MEDVVYDILLRCGAARGEDRPDLRARTAPSVECQIAASWRDNPQVLPGRIVVSTDTELRAMEAI
jgi:hypothetical protein